MKNDSSTQCWNNISEEWYMYAQTNDFRMDFIMPFTLQQIGNVSGKMILDIGCGEGGYSRELARKGAVITAVDCNEGAIHYSRLKAEEEELKISHFIRNSNDLQDISDSVYDVVLSSMMLMDCEDFNGTVKEISRVLKPRGKLYVSILHPCFNGKDIRWSGVNSVPQVVVNDYFTPTEWEAPIAKSIDSIVIWRHHTLQEYVKTFVKYNMMITDMNEPLPNEQQIAKSPRLGCLSKIPMFLFIELEKVVK